MPPHVLYRVLDNHNRIQAPLPTTPAHFYSIFMTLFYFNHYFLDLGFATGWHGVCGHILYLNNKMDKSLFIKVF